MTAEASLNRRAYRPELDGMRTLAVMVVVAFHAQVSGFDGGFIGVDMFFVLSGYLITGLLVNEAASGSVDLRRFYARRSRRLLPASLLAITAIAATWLLTASFVARRPLIGDARAASLYFANWHFAAQATDYFAIGNQPSPYLHFWSLAVEEQFYMVWPAVVVVCFAIGRRVQHATGLVVVRVVGALAALASVISVLATSAAGNESFAYFATHNRVYQLLGGGLLGTVAIRASDARWVRWVQGVSLAAIVGVALSVVHLSPTSRGLATTAATLTLLWSVSAAPTNAVGKVFALRPLVWLGTLSYAIYLWHWPTILVLQRFTHLDNVVIFAAATGISIALAVVSKHLLEHPIRTSARLSRHHLHVVGAGLALSALIGLTVAPRLLESTRRPVFAAPRAATPPPASTRPVTTPATTPDHSPTTTPSTTPPPVETLPSAATIDAVVRDGPALPCLERRGPVCLVHRGSKSTMLIIGDSHLHALVNSLADISARRDVSLWVFLQHLCPWEEGVTEAGPLKASCRSTKEQLYGSVLASLQPDVVFAVGRGYDDSAMKTKLTGPDGVLRTPSAVLSEQMPHAVATVLQHANQLIVLEPWPSLPFIQRDCLAAAQTVAECAGQADWPLQSTGLLQQIASSEPRLRLISLNDLICPRLPTCDAVVHGLIVRVDHNHLNYQFGVTLAAVLEQRLADAGAFATSP